MTQRLFLFALFAVSSIIQCLSLNYDPSKIYTYSYTTDIALNDANIKKASPAQKDVGVQLKIKFKLSTIYKDSNVQLFKLVITEGQVASYVNTKIQQDLDKSVFQPVYFKLSDSLVQNLYFVEDSIFSHNVKKGIVNLFQVQEEAGERTEVDVSGECQVRYSIPEPGVVDRTKSDCLNLEIARQYSNSNRALGVSMYVKATSQYRMKDSIIESVTASHRAISYLNIRPGLNGGALSTQKLVLESTTANNVFLSSSEEAALATAEEEAGSSLSLSLLPSEEETQQCQQDCQTPESLAIKLEEDLKAENIATVKSAKAFIQLLKSFRGSGKATLTKVMTGEKSYYIVPQLIDVATAAQTEAAKESLFGLLDFSNEDAVEYPQRFLFAAAYSSHPSESLIADLLAIVYKKVPNESLRESLLLSLGAIVHTFCQVKDQCNSKVIEKFKAMVTSELLACKEESCQLMYLRALGNAGLASTVKSILPFAESPRSPMLATTAISAFRRIHNKFITSQVKEAMLRIFHQNRANYDTSVRIAALELLLDISLSDQELRNILLICVNQSEPEFTTYVTKLLQDSATVNSLLRQQILYILQDTRMNNYNVWAQSGKSSVITSYLAKMQDVNSTYNLFFENSPSGVMKRSGMVVNLLGKTIKQAVMKFGIYASGLESLMGQEETAAASNDDKSVDDEEPSAEATAGMSFSFLDVLLTQVEFFRGMSGLMSAAWNAPSELTSALQGNLLLQDHSQRIHLSNGLVLNTQVLGVLSMDLSGLISISLWNRNCDALIRTSGALYLEGSLKVDSTLFNLGLTFTGEGQSNIDYTSKADFYEMPLKLCMQMLRPDFEFLQNLVKYEQIKKGKKYRSKVTQKIQVPGESYFLNKANSEECRAMMKDE
ncbi:unnamed protein product [Lymnaea stagnalis]|uniref:Vitellogenin domain-containing protein n=1 Tax=Lymnaea stagnalis TaxID=6523 RepID=A0AAV2H5E3_LYMST